MQEVDTMQRGRLIILNGGSSAGKTSLAEELQDAMLPETWLLMGIDMFWLSLPPRELNLESVSPDYYSWKSEIAADGKEWFTVTPGPILDKIMFGRYRALRSFLDAGLSIVSDDVKFKHEWLIDAMDVLHGYDVYYIGVYVSDEEGERREVARGDRHVGWDRASAHIAHQDCIYDFTVDTTENSPEQAALLVKQAVLSMGRPSAFDRMRERFSRVSVS